MAGLRIGMTRSEVEARLELPARKVKKSAADLWAYDLGRLDKYKYSIRVTYAEDQVTEKYLRKEIPD